MKKVFIFKLLGAISLLLSACTPAADSPNNIRHAVRDGNPERLRTEQYLWKADSAGGLSSESMDNVLYLDGFVGSGDFQIEARLVLDGAQHDEAAFVMNEYDLFGFSGYENRFYVKGRRLGTALLAGETGAMIVPGRPFDFVGERTGDTFRVSINGQQVFETPFAWRWGGEFGFRCLRVLDFSVTADFLSLEEYVFNSPLYGRDTGPLQIAPVVLPEGTALVDNNWHFGWPIAAKSGDAMVTSFPRHPFHHGASRTVHPSKSWAVFVRSLDGGLTWSEPYDLEPDIKRKPSFKPGGMRAIGSTSRGTLLLMGSFGLFRSTDAGETWIHLPDAFEKVMDSEVRGLTLGPDIVETAAGRLLAFAAVVNPANKLADWILCWTSSDDGISWKWSKIPLPDGFFAAEPTPCIVNDQLYILGRFHHQSDMSFNQESGLYSMMQLSMPVDAMTNITARVTNIRTTHAVDVLSPLCGESKAQAFGLWSQDTPDMSYNPVTKRLEAIVTNRTGGGAGDEQDITMQTLNLWSMDPDDFAAGKSEWTFEATLLQRYIMDVPKFSDGMHPAASVIDAENGVQHIFVYLGYYHGPTGIFRITRPLETHKVKEWWNSVKQKKTEEEKMKARKYFAALGMAAALTNSVQAELIAEGMILHLEGSTANVESGLWNDSSTNRHVFTVNPGWSVPEVKPEGLNGRPAVVFSSEKKTGWELRGRLADIFNPRNGEMTFFIVSKPASFGGWQSLMRKGNDQPGQPGYVIGTIPGGGAGRFVTRLSTMDSAQDAGVQSVVRNQSPAYKVYNVVLDGKKVAAYLNGDPAVALNNPVGPNIDYAGDISTERNLSVGWGFNGEIAEIIVYNKSLSLDQINQVNEYLKEKYALSFGNIFRLK